MHPEDREKALKSLVTGPLKQAEKAAQVAQQQTAKTVEKLEAKILDLTKRMEMGKSQLAVRQRMTPQDMRDALNALFDTYNFSPAEELVQMLMLPSHPYYITEPAQRVAVLKDLNAYVMPKLKSTEITGEVKHKHTITIMRIGPDGQANREAAAIPIEAKVEMPRIVDRTAPSEVMKRITVGENQ